MVLIFLGILSLQGRDWYSSTAMERCYNIGTLGGEESQGSGINDSGYVVGWSHNGSVDRHALTLRWLRRA